MGYTVPGSDNGPKLIGNPLSFKQRFNTVTQRNGFIGRLRQEQHESIVVVPGYQISFSKMVSDGIGNPSQGSVV
jgi:hypothetical protein